MPSITRRVLLASTLALGLAGTAAAEFPERQVTLVIPFAAGGSTDVVGRIVAERMSAELGQQIVVQNVGGAGGSLRAGVTENPVLAGAQQTALAATRNEVFDTIQRRTAPPPARPVTRREP